MNETALLVLRELERRQKEMGITSDYVIATKEGNPMLVHQMSYNQGV